MKNLNHIYKPLLFLVLILNIGVCLAQKETILLKEFVTDNAQLFSNTETEGLNEKLVDFERKTTHQIVVLTIKSLQGETIENYALKTFAINKIGQKEVDNGILIVVSKEDREVRIEVGYGLEPIITDAVASRIIREIFTPNFKNGDYFKGIDSGVSKIITLIDNPDLINEFIKTEEEEENTESSFIVRIYTATFYTPFLLFLGLFVTNRTVRKNKKIKINELYQANRKRFFAFIGLSILIIAAFIKTFTMIFFSLFILGFLGIFVGIGIMVLLKGACQRAIEVFQGVFTGDLGVFRFPFYLPGALFLFLGGLFFTLLPLLGGTIIVLQTVFEIDINELFKSFEPVYIPLFLIACFSLFLFITGIIAFRRVQKKQNFGFSLFKSNVVFSTSFSSSGSTSSSRSSYSSSYSSSSSSSFSGGGGSSGGGGASGSW